MGALRSGGGGVHPIIVVSDEAICAEGPEVLAVPGTSNLTRPPLPYHYEPAQTVTGLPMVTRFKCEGLVPVRKENISTITGRISRFEYMKLQECLMRALHTENTGW